MTIQHLIIIERQDKIPAEEGRVEHMAMTNISETTEIICDVRVTAYSERSRRSEGSPA